MTKSKNYDGRNEIKQHEAIRRFDFEVYYSQKLVFLYLTLAQKKTEAKKKPV